MSFQDNFYKNFNAIKIFRPEMVPYIKEDILYGIEPPEKTKTGSYSIKYKGILLHSAINPEKEADRFAERLKLSEGEEILLYGFGLSYHIRSILSRLPGKGSLIVVEANVELISIALFLSDITDLIADKRLDILTGDTEAYISSRLSLLCKDAKDKKVCVHFPSFSLIPQGFERIQNAFEILLMERRFDTIFGDLEKENLRFNRETSLQSKGGKEFFNAWKGKKAVLIGAGPSLDANRHYLKSLYKNSIIVCVDASLRILVKEGIEPDFVVTVDPQEAAVRHFTGLFDSTVPLLFIPTANYKILRYYKGEKVVLFQDKKDILNISNKEIADKGVTSGGGSVSCIALDFLVKTGADPIIFIGQDFSYPNSRRYAKDSAEYEELCSSIDQFNSIDALWERKTNSQKRVYVENRDREKIATHQNLYSYIRYMESIIKNNSNIKFFNLNSRGAVISGARDISSPWEAD